MDTTKVQKIDIDFSDSDQLLAELKSVSEVSEPKLKFITAGELLSKKLETLPKLIDPIFPKVGLVCLAGSSDTGKSALLRQLCLHVVTGEDRFIGFPVTPTHKKAIYVSTEDDSQAVSYLLNIQNKAKNYTPEQLEGLKYIFESENVLETIDTLLMSDPVDVVVIDCLTDLFGGKGSLNESTQVRAFLNPYKELADRHQCLVIFLHHTGKRTDESEPSKRNLLGSQGIEAKMRMVAELRADPVDTSIRHLCLVKGNYLSAEYKKESYVLRFDDDMIFKNTGNRKPFEELQKQRSPERSPEQREQLITQVIELHNAGVPQRKIAEQLKIALGTVNNYVHGVHVHANPTFR